MIDLIFDEFDPYEQYSICIRAEESIEICKKIEFIESVDFLCGAKWSSLSEGSINKKIRCIISKINEAIRQIPEDVNGIVHVGYETADPASVESMKVAILDEQIKSMEMNNKCAAIIINAFMGINIKSPKSQGKLASIDAFDCRETQIIYKNDLIIKNEFGIPKFIFVQENSGVDGFSHWEIDQIKFPTD